jgi:poly-gamma-glutamate synthesis protein (capsule biosynthesis protein)
VNATSSVTVLAAGDMMFDTRRQMPRVFYHYPEFSSCSTGFEGHFRIPFPCTEDNEKWLASLQRSTYGIAATAHDPTCRREQIAQNSDYPFDALRSELLAADVVFGNLECPLSERGRRLANDMSYRASTEYADALARAGFRVVSVANNHMFDYGETALHDTLEALRRNGIATAGAGGTLAEARMPAIVETNGPTCAFLAYCMVGPDIIYATFEECGVAPANPRIVAEDIRAARQRADLVFVSLHWGIESRPVPWPRMVELARDIIDAGADAILGHHSHVAGSVELYRGRPIFYSLGNFSFGHQHEGWIGGLLARLTCNGSGIEFVQLLPITSAVQPARIKGDPARHFLGHLQAISNSAGSHLEFDGDSAWLRLP